MSRRKEDRDFEDDQRVIADMSGLRSSRPFSGQLPDGSEKGLNEKSSYDGGMQSGWEPPPFSWRERLHYAGAALGAALLIGGVFIAGLGLVIWLITLYGMK